MKTRVISAVIAVAVFIPFIILGGGYFAFIMALLGLLALKELADMKQINYRNLVGITASIGLLAILVPSHYIAILSQFVNKDYLFYICCLLLLVITVFKSDEFNFDHAAVLMLGAIYIGYGFHFLIVIRDMGIDTLMYQFLVIWATDSGAYLVGRRFGATKLAPTVSPNKTVEGLAGGLLLASLVGGLYNFLVQPNLGDIHHVWMLTLAMSMFGQLGDLVESAFKRHFGVKDSGQFLPGHGGVLDRFDSSIFTSFLLMIWMNLFR